MARKRRVRYVSKNKSYTVRRLAVLLGALIILVCAGVGVTLLIKGGVDSAKPQLMPFKAGTPYAYSAGSVYYLDGEDMVYDKLDSNEAQTRIPLGTGEANIAATDGMTIVYNSASAHVVGELYPVEFAGTVLSASCGRTYFGVLSRDDTGGAKLGVYDKTGAQVDQHAEDGAMIEAFGFRGEADNEQLWLLTVDTSASELVSYITSFSYSGSAPSTTGMTMVIDQLVEGVTFSSNGMYVLGTSDISRYDLTNNQRSYHILTYGYKVASSCVTGDKAVFIMLPRENAANIEKSGMLSEDVLGTKIAVKLVSAPQGEGTGMESSVTVQLKEDAVAVYAVKNGMLAVCKNELRIYALSGELSSTINTGIGDITGASRVSDTKFMLESEGKMYLIDIAKKK